MTTLASVKQFVQNKLRQHGYALYRMTDDECKAWAEYAQKATEQSLEELYGESLERLQELRKSYAQVKLPVAEHSIWATRNSSSQDARTELGWGGVDLRRFRAHSAYVWDYANAGFELTRLKYFIFAQYTRQRDQLRLLDRLDEDGAFGCLTFDFEGFGLISRDLLDSVIELNFLQDHIGLFDQDHPSILDIGAGYGRMAYRTVEAHPGTVKYTCVDAIPESTFLNECYMQHRGLTDRVRVLPLTGLESELQPKNYSLALNIHSFSECTYAAVEWWLRKVADLKIKHLMIVPNEPDLFQSMERDGTKKSYRPLLAELGYDQIAEEPVFADAQVQALIGVKDRMYIFEAK